ncbi:hypothetical protein ACIQB5_51890 [Streptomyces sp. NPDC088560]|uniref:hypothetical protein n=1 Tax=Streptomyces sp. NPDC088560 TaxID=3365868 RepID=UPI0037F27A36
MPQEIEWYDEVKVSEEIEGQINKIQFSSDRQYHLVRNNYLSIAHATLVNRMARRTAFAFEMWSESEYARALVSNWGGGAKGDALLEKVGNSSVKDFKRWGDSVLDRVDSEVGFDGRELRKFSESLIERAWPYVARGYQVGAKPPTYTLAAATVSPGRTIQASSAVINSTRRLVQSPPSKGLNR